MLYEEMSGWTFKQFMNNKGCFPNKRWFNFYMAQENMLIKCCLPIPGRKRPDLVLLPKIQFISRCWCHGQGKTMGCHWHWLWGECIPKNRLGPSIWCHIWWPIWDLNIGYLDYPISSHWGGLKGLFCIAIHFGDALQTHPRYHRCIDTLW